MWACGTNFMKQIFMFMCQKIKLMKQINPFKKGFVIFLKGATFSDFF